MLNALRGLGHDQFEFARWAPETYDKYKFIRVGVVDDREKQWNTVIANLITDSSHLVLRTSYLYDYAPRQHIYFRDKWYEIIAATELTQRIAPQSARLVKGGSREFVLELSEVTDYDV